MIKTTTKKMTKNARGWALVIIAITLIAAVLTAWWTAYTEDLVMRARDLTQTRLVAQAIDVSQVISLSGSLEDVSTPNYLRLKEQFSQIRQADPSCRFVYLVGRRSDGAFFIFIDSEPAGSKEESPPGQIYDEAPEQLGQVFVAGIEAIVGPYTDRWGTWVSAFVPIDNPHSGALIAVLGMDVDKRTWKADVIKRCAMPVGLVVLTSLLGCMLVALGASRKRIQAKHTALQESEDRLKTIMEATLAGVVVIEEQTSIIIDVNLQVVELIGIPKDQIIGRTCYQFICPAESGKSPASDLGRTLAKSEDVLVSVDGRRIPVIKTVTRVWIGGKQCLVGSFLDISDRKQMEEALRQSEERHRALFNSSQDAIMTLEPPSWRFASGNPACFAMFGTKDEKEFTSHGLGDLSPERQPDKRLSSDQAKEMIDIAMRKGSHFFEWRHKRLGGGEFPATVMLTRFKVGGQSILQATVKDVSKQKQLEMELNQAQKLEAVGRLAAGIAHEINTPTQYVGDNIEFLQIAYDGLVNLAKTVPSVIEAGREGPIPAQLLSQFQNLVENTSLDYLVAQVPRAIEQALEGIGRIATIVQAMKEFSHPGVAEKTTVDLNQCIRSTVTVSHSEWKYVADVEMELDAALPSVWCLPGELNQVFLNLIVNAAHAIGDVTGENTESKGKIVIRSRQDGDWVEVQIADTGLGIPEEIQNRIFDPFFTTKEVGRGTGQGLAIAHSVVVDKHGGAITFKSKVGIGTTFTIRLPINTMGDSASTP